ncbi:MAG: hypothetical protein WA747_13755 [Steroidobacteraceae bacterium]
MPALAADVTVQPAAKHHIYLWGPGDLGRLRATKPGHYARAEKILAAAGRLCRPGPARLQFTAAGGRDVRCYGILLRTSNPPKLEIDFTLDDTRYSALITITDDPPRVIPAR